VPQPQETESEAPAASSAQPISEPATAPQALPERPSSPSPAQTSQPASIHRSVDKEPKRPSVKTTGIHVPKGSGRQRHEEKITFYCTKEELLALERARLILREFGLGADRGRIVREALSYTLAELEANGAASVLVDRLGRR
jgi:hypothetical protein